MNNPMSLYMPIPYPGDEYFEEAHDAAEAMRIKAKYSDSDWTHRHRLPDGARKDVTVTAYNRRRPGK